MKRVIEISQLPKGSLRLAKSLVRSEAEIKRLREVCHAETKVLETRWSSKECEAAVQAFFDSRAK